MMAIPSQTSLLWLPPGFGGTNAGLDVLKLENIEFKDLIFSRGDQSEGGGAGVESYKGGFRDGQVRRNMLHCKMWEWLQRWRRFSLTSVDRRRHHLSTPNFHYSHSTFMSHILHHYDPRLIYLLCLSLKFLIYFLCSLKEKVVILGRMAVPTRGLGHVAKNTAGANIVGPMALPT